MSLPLRNFPRGQMLFDILNCLPEFGVGRVFTRTSWLARYPNEPSYIRITSVTLNPERWPMLNGGEIWAIPTWRGYSRDGLEVKIASWYKTEWKLIRKSEEEEFCSYIPKEDDFHAVPSSIPLPPLLERMMREKMKKGGDVNEDKLKLKFSINQTYGNRAYQMPEI